MKEIRLVLIMGGGVSLGTYPAGALTELYHALGEINRLGNTPARVEVIVGASAGSMTAAIFAKALVADDPAVTAMMHEAWVNQIDITKLAPADATTFNALALLQSDVVDAIGARALEPPAATAPWSYATETIYLAFTGTNLGGIPLSMPYAKRDGAMVFDNHADAFITRLNKADPSSLITEKWTGIRVAAIASGAFPVAFPPREVPRNRNDPPIRDFEFLSFPDGTANPLGMWYCDGGVFDNEPIGLAKKLVAACPDYDNPDVEYRYLVVDHDLSRSTWKPLETPTSLPGALGALVGAVLEQGTSKDFLRATKVNEHANSQRIAVSGELLPLILAIPAVQLAAIQAQLARALEQAIAIHFFDADDHPTVPQIAVKVTEQQARINASKDYAAALSGLTVPQHAVLVDTILLSEVTAGLLDKRILNINIVAPPPAAAGKLALAGAFLWNFGGFFDRDWRQHDFDCGRRDARLTLTRDMGLDYPADDSANYAPADIDSGPEYVSAQRKAELQTYLTKRLEALIRPPLDELAAGAPFLVRPLARWLIPRIPEKLAQVLLGKAGLG